MARMLPREAELVRNEQVCQGRKSVKRFERYNGLDTALYKNVHLKKKLTGHYDRPASERYETLSKAENYSTNAFLQR